MLGMGDLKPATDQLTALVGGVGDESLNAPTPCQIPVAALLDHVQNLARTFTAAAGKVVNEWVIAPPKPDAAHLGEGWRERIPDLLAALAAAWAEPGSREGMTRVGAQEMPAAAACVVALDEVVLHSWDLGVATRQPYDPPDEWLEPLLPFLEHVAEPEMAPAREGLFGPPLAVPEGALLFERVLRLAGRDPGWHPGTA